MVWWPFAPQPERADTTEVTDLNNGAPPLYSVILLWLRPAAALGHYLRDVLTCVLKRHHRIGAARGFTVATCLVANGGY